MARVLVLSLTDLSREPRVDRQIGWLRAAGHEVVAAGRAPSRHDDVRFVPFRDTPAGGARGAVALAWRQALRSSGAWERAYWSTPAFRDLRAALPRERFDAVVVDDLFALPVGFAAADGAPVLWDAHEYSPEEVLGARWWRLLMRPYVVRMVRALVPRLAAMTTVSAGIADLYAADTGVRPELLLNAPDPADLQPTPVGDVVRLVHWGGADPQRRLELMFDVMRHLGDRFTLDVVLVGNENYQRQLRKRADGDPRIAFPPPVPMPDLPRFGNAYDVGLFLLPIEHANQRFALPNKFFEFVQARLAVAVGPSPEMARLAEDHGFGIVADSFDPAAMARRLEALSREDLTELKTRAHAAAGVLNAEQGRATFLGLVDGMLA